MMISVLLPSVSRMACKFVSSSSNKAVGSGSDSAEARSEARSAVSVFFFE